ncbi:MULTISPECIES: ABC transporter substrate-binding protein [unclassified Rathayibacter]|jgi:NitT/TauT family transport system substrate-binding protein|uniref:ABC transporter substrate-binding protein n=1 Tax=unclassified Rathayibacter TaxID=2609250 RepID=UPI000CE9014C|nr:MULTISPECIES: ABC transporter substrate-binding protein [unclassified Rathayibacter]PPG85681.1 ABC transporter substrate-binding protein [Rathayibacter sp. AY1H2]PPH19237.1 ABC transporter substrate-binding protein [Rathayibacter sp. AY1F8]PPH35397.1 ABC transporter substrate-binding protein [Rathayibacter sp. AY1E3]
MDTLTVSATANGLNYLPEYVADVGGLFAERGLAVTATACDPWTGVLDDLDSGAADLALGGLWVPGMYAGTSRELIVVGQLNHRFPMTIVARDGSGPVGLDWLAGKVVLAPGAGGSAPFEFTAGLIREAGLDVSATRWARDLSTAMMLELYRDGLGDAIVLDLLSAKELVAAGGGQIVFRHLDAGVMPNSVYYTRTERVEELADRTERFVDAIETAMQRITAGEAGAEIDAVLAARWPDRDSALLHEAADEMAAGGVWDTTVIDEAASDRWMRILAEAGLVTRAPSLAELTGRATVGAR